jgi:hypothetical protein
MVVYLHILPLCKEEVNPMSWQDSHLFSILIMLCLGHHSSCSVGRQHIALTTTQNNEMRNVDNTLWIKRKKRKKGRILVYDPSPLFSKVVTFDGLDTISRLLVSACFLKVISAPSTSQGWCVDPMQ